MRDNFFVLENGDALLKDFFRSYETHDWAVFDKEMAEVEKALARAAIR